MELRNNNQGDLPPANRYRAATPANLQPAPQSEGVLTLTVPAGGIAAGSAVVSQLSGHHFVQITTTLELPPSPVPRPPPKNFTDGDESDDATVWSSSGSFRQVLHLRASVPQPRGEIMVAVLEGRKEDICLLVHRVTSSKPSPSLHRPPLDYQPVSQRRTGTRVLGQLHVPLRSELSLNDVG